MVRPLENMSLLQRVVLTLVIIAVVLFLLMVASWFSSSAQPLVLTLPPSKWDAKIIELDKQALDEAYIAKVKQLYDVYVREGREHHERPVKGATEARRAYIDIQRAIEMREQIIKDRQ